VSRLAAERVKVVLTGEDSDETLGGCGRYRYTVWNMTLGRVAEGLTGSMGRRLGSAMVDRLPQGSRWRSRLRHTALSRPATLDDLYCDNFAVFDRQAIRALLSGRWSTSRSGTASSSTASRQSMLASTRLPWRCRVRPIASPGLAFVAEALDVRCLLAGASHPVPCLELLMSVSQISTARACAAALRDSGEY